MYMGIVLLGRLKIHTAEPIVPVPNAFQVEMAAEKIKMYRSPGTDPIPAELTKAGGNNIFSELPKLINFTWNKDKLPEQWKESIIVPVYKKGDKRDFSNYRGILLLSTACKVLLKILLSMLTPCA
jgi:hypothetical protein